MCRSAIAATVVLALAGSPAMAKTYSPPGNSAVEEYQEVVPDAGGKTPTNTVNPGQKQSALPKSTQRALQSQGATGAQVEQFIQASAPAAVRKQVAKGGASVTPTRDFSANSASGDAPASSAIKASLTSQDTPGGSMGIALPLILLGTTFGGGLVYFLRRRGPA